MHPLSGRYLLSFLFDKVCDLIQEQGIAGNNQDGPDLSEYSISAKPKDWAKKVFDNVTVKTLNEWIKAGKIKVEKVTKYSWEIRKCDLPEDYEARLRRIDIS